MAKVPTPIAVFTYKRPIHAARLLESLANNTGIGVCPVNIFCDGPKGAHEVQEVEACRLAIAPLARKLGARVYHRESNQGLAASIVGGVSILCREYGRVVVLEEDLVVRPDFLSYMINALDAFESNEEVFQISGYSYPIRYGSDNDAFFSPLTTTWGWGTWQRAWCLWQKNAPGYEAYLGNEQNRREFNADGAYPLDEMLKKQVSAGIDSWGILWYYAVRRVKGLTLWPEKSLIWNGGIDGTGTHGAKGGRYNEGSLENFLSAQVHTEWRFPGSAMVDKNAYAKIVDFLRDLTPKKKSLIERAMWYIWRTFMKRE